MLCSIDPHWYITLKNTKRSKILNREPSILMLIRTPSSCVRVCVSAVYVCMCGRGTQMMCCWLCVWLMHLKRKGSRWEGSWRLTPCRSRDDDNVITPRSFQQLLSSPGSRDPHSGVSCCQRAPKGVRQSCWEWCLWVNRGQGEIKPRRRERESVCLFYRFYQSKNVYTVHTRVLKRRANKYP